MALYDVIKKKLDELAPKIGKMAAAELRILIEQEFSTAFVSKVLEIYDRELVAHEGRIGDKDPTSPSALRPAFASYLRANASKFFSIGGGQLSLNRSYLEDFGFPSGPGEEETEPLKLLYFYFAGIIGTYGFISVEDYKAFKGRPYNPRWGRFGKGFFIERGAYISVAKSHQNAPKFSEIVSPLSGRSGVDVIQLAFHESTDVMKALIKKAVSKAVENYNKGIT